jgi:hypothetical protein
VGAYERFINQFKQTESNLEFLDSIPGGNVAAMNNRSFL